MINYTHNSARANKNIPGSNNAWTATRRKEKACWLNNQHLYYSPASAATSNRCTRWWQWRPRRRWTSTRSAASRPVRCIRVRPVRRVVPGRALSDPQCTGKAAVSSTVQPTVDPAEPPDEDAALPCRYRRVDSTRSRPSVAAAESRKSVAAPAPAPESSFCRGLILAAPSNLRAQPLTRRDISRRRLGVPPLSVSCSSSLLQRGNDQFARRTLLWRSRGPSTSASSPSSSDRPKRRTRCQHLPRRYDPRYLKILDDEISSEVLGGFFLEISTANDRGRIPVAHSECISQCHFDS